MSEQARRRGAVVLKLVSSRAQAVPLRPGHGTPSASLPHGWFGEEVGHVSELAPFAGAQAGSDRSN